MEVVLAIAVVGVLVLGWIVSTSNRYARLENLVRESWADVDVALKRRHDLIPNLVETVKGFAIHERDVLERVVQARNSAIQGNAQAETELARAVSSLLFRAEAYPDLRSSTNFLQLQHELVNTEDRIAAARRFYNANVRDFNVLLESFPSSLLAGGRTAKEPYEIESISARETPQVSLP